jgi:hypothetical protein
VRNLLEIVFEEEMSSVADEEPASEKWAPASGKEPPLSGRRVPCSGK